MHRVPTKEAWRTWPLCFTSANMKCHMLDQILPFHGHMAILALMLAFFHGGHCRHGLHSIIRAQCYDRGMHLARVQSLGDSGESFGRQAPSPIRGTFRIDEVHILVRKSDLLVHI